MTTTDNIDERIASGIQAFKKIKRSNALNFAMWVAVAEGLEAGKQKLLQRLQLNRLDTYIGRNAFSSWLKESGYQAVPAAERTYLAKIIENLPEIQAWQASLSDAQRLRWNHPRMIWSHWQRQTTVALVSEKETIELTDRIAVAAKLVLKIVETYGQTSTGVMNMIRADITARRGAKVKAKAA